MVTPNNTSRHWSTYHNLVHVNKPCSDSRVLGYYSPCRSSPTHSMSQQRWDRWTQELYLRANFSSSFNARSKAFARTLAATRKTSLVEAACCKNSSSASLQPQAPRKQLSQQKQGDKVHQKIQTPKVNSTSVPCIHRSTRVCSQCIA
jgi:hypothetical protein